MILHSLFTLPFLYHRLVEYKEDGNKAVKQPYEQVSPDFFDLIIIDECHRGSVRDDSEWRNILEYFSSAIQIGLTATPVENKNVSNSEYFAEPVYNYSLKQGIEDGFNTIPSY